ncbi:flagella basal body P-ring formation protein FlgA [Epibacterium ulvae]|uniref:Flagella basal body P-ring formation protein FlgA n=1 Tax=Epibacterium ulvae TaxID=1156985 RepID=A0A1G5RKY3_9RHOB|nr:flagellar basal body P-ring formation chaperone FlgA [Epibacterium ulvae]SCZ74041.1 flagella basal body P-ring formation protein FlgA [Epibacterium ulvae]
MKLSLALVMTFCAQTVWADILVPTRTIRPKEVISIEDLGYKNAEVSGALKDLNAIVGKEARIALYAGRPIHAGDIGPPAIIERNDLVSLTFHRGGLRISTEGRSLGRGAAGETVRVMNLSSRTTISGRITADGSVEVN